MKRDPKPDLSGATIFTSSVPIDERDLPKGGPYFTDTNMNEPGRTLNGEPIPQVRDDTDLNPPLSENDKKWMREWVDDKDQSPDVDAAQMRDLSSPQDDKDNDDDGPLSGIDWKRDRLDGTKVKNRSCWPSIFVANAKMPDSLVKANAVRRGASANEYLKDLNAPIGFTGHIHPLSDVAETKSAAALANDDVKGHEDAAKSHDAAAAKMAAFQKEVKPSKKNTGTHNQIRGLQAAHEHHKKKAALHRDRSAFLAHGEEKKKAEKDAKKK